MRLFAAIFGILLLASTFPVQAQDLPFEPRTNNEQERPTIIIENLQTVKHLNDIILQLINSDLTDVGQEYLTNKLIKDNANTKVRTDATVQNVLKLFGGYTMLLAYKDGSDYHYKIKCYFEDDVPDILYTLKKKDKILVSGYLESYEFGDVKLNNCEISKL